MSDSSPPEKRSRKKAASSESYRKAFTEVFQELRAELTQEDLRDSEISDGIAHLDEVSMRDREERETMQRGRG